MTEDVSITRKVTGFEVRLRYGKDQRGRFLIATLDETKAQRRANKLRELAAALATRGNPAVAKDILTQCAGATTDSEFQDFARRIEDFCGVKPVRAHAKTFQQLGEDWTSGELHRKHPDHIRLKRSVYDDKQRLGKLYDTVGNVPLDRFTLADAKRAMSALPSKLGAASRRHYAQLLCRVLKMAVFPCELIDRNPLPPGWLPTVRDSRAKSFLYPSDDAQLLASDKVPLAYRVLYGFLAREGLRLGEALSLRWTDLDLDLGTIRLDVSKTDDPRFWRLSDGVPFALQAYRNMTPASERVFPNVEKDGAADLFRKHLRAGSVARAELFEDTEHRQQIRVHDLRATFVTLGLANGRSEAWIADRTGHKSSQMINKYRRAARQVQELQLGTLAPLNEAIPELRPRPLRRAEIARPEVWPTPWPSPDFSAELEITNPAIYSVGHEGLEPSASGLRELAGQTSCSNTCEKAAYSDASDTSSDTEWPTLWPTPGQADAVEQALAEALQRASAAGAWTVVERLAGELEARRLERLKATGLAPVVPIHRPKPNK